MQRPSSRPLWPSPHQKIQNLLDDRKYAQHRQRIKTATPVVDTTSPVKYQHLQVKLKKIQIESERQAKILQENLLLLKRMSDILHSKGPFGYPRPSCKKSSGHHQWTTSTPDSLDTCLPKLLNDKLEEITKLKKTAELKQLAEDSKLCPRYLRQLRGQGDQRFLPMMVGPRRTTSSVTPTPSSQKSSCEACKEQSKRVNKSADLVRPKAATPRRKSQPLTAQSVESEQGDQAKDEQCTSINLSEKFRKDFGLDE